MAKSGDRLVPGAFDSDYTRPTTSYRTRKTMPTNARPGDAATLRMEHAHWPLIWMLVLTQAAVGIFLGAALLALLAPVEFATGQAPLSLSAFVSVRHRGPFNFGAWQPNASQIIRGRWAARDTSSGNPEFDRGLNAAPQLASISKRW